MVKKYNFILIISSLLLLSEFTVWATDYYLSSSGNDQNTGLSSTDAWKTTTKLNSCNFTAGDRIFLEGGTTFYGGIYFDAIDTGTALNPIILTSYGDGQATIFADSNTISGNGFLGENCYGLKITNIRFVGPEKTAGDGISIVNSVSGDIKFEYIYIDSVEVCNFGVNGIIIGGWNSKSGYKDITIINSIIHDNKQSGISIYGQTAYSNENVYIAYSKIYNISGSTGQASTNGNGIIIGSVNGGIIERCVINNNGWLCESFEGPSGISIHDSNNIIVQYNESYDNKTGSTNDGNGFKLGFYTTNCILQYNYSHDNTGAGYILCHYPLSWGLNNNTVRYNISQNDGRENGYGGITLYGRIKDTEIYNNTVFTGQTVSTVSAVVYIWNYGIQSQTINKVHFRNNIFISSGNVYLINISEQQLMYANDLLFQSNDYYSYDNNFMINWGDKLYTEFSNWRTETSMEHIGSTEIGLNTDPQLVAPGEAPTLNDTNLLNTLTAYILQSSSTLIDSGLDLKALFNIDTGLTDFYGNAIPQGTGYDIGSNESYNPSAGLYIRGFIKDIYNNPLADVTVTLATGTVTKTTLTTAYGFYQFLNVTPGLNYIITPTKTNYEFNPPDITTGTLITNIDNLNFVATPITILDVEPTTLEFGELVKNEIKTLTFTISNIGAGTLSGTIISDQSWITVSPSEFSNITDSSQTVSVTVNNRILNKVEGQYTGNIYIVSNGGNTTVTVSVRAICVLAAPNPYNPKEGLLTFFGNGIVPGKTTIRIYTLSGELVKIINNSSISAENEITNQQYTNEIVWDGKNEFGEPVIDGIYLYTYNSPKEKGVGKFILIKK